MRRTGRTQTEATKTGIITTAEEVGYRHGRKTTRWVQIGYTSIVVNDDGTKAPSGAYGQALVKEA